MFPHCVISTARVLYPIGRVFSSPLSCAHVLAHEGDFGWEIIRICWVSVKRLDITFDMIWCDTNKLNKKIRNIENKKALLKVVILQDSQTWGCTGLWLHITCGHWFWIYPFTMKRQISSDEHILYIILYLFICICYTFLEQQKGEEGKREDRTEKIRRDSHEQHSVLYNFFLKLFYRSIQAAVYYAS